ncbi:5-formyltetrahydrofolate cyclo-ligase [Tenacibaculum sp. C7A-26P2]|uniref:5-formyltetrahydrofolate cyclo-ligase n=1 Tax=Tenacibaculum sp. C7A-26P2 TaxID=3447504 RepID=UPI003F86BA88
MNKKEARRLFKQKRKALTTNIIDTYLDSIYAQVFQIDFSRFQNIHIFLPIARQKEINTFPIISYIQNLGKRVIISKSNFENNTLEHFILTKDTKLVENTYGIPEPVAAEKFDVKNIDLVFVPLLISDEMNYRVGYGKGFYDRFLASCKKDVYTIGLNFFPPIPTITDINKFDVPLHSIIFSK